MATMPETTIMHGYFSRQAFEHIVKDNRSISLAKDETLTPPGCIYLTPDGGEVLITCVSSSPDSLSTRAYAWHDAVYVGVVTRYVRQVWAA